MLGLFVLIFILLLLDSVNFLKGGKIIRNFYDQVLQKFMKIGFKYFGFFRSIMSLQFELKLCLESVVRVNQVLVKLK